MPLHWILTNTSEANVITPLSQITSFCTPHGYSCKEKKDLSREKGEAVVLSQPSGSTSGQKKKKSSAPHETLDRVLGSWRLPRFCFFAQDAAPSVWAQDAAPLGCAAAAQIGWARRRHQLGAPSWSAGRAASTGSPRVCAPPSPPSASASPPPWPHRPHWLRPPPVVTALLKGLDG
jgi:hypothetical protein